MGARTCSRCVNLRDADGYCSRRGEYRNALADAPDGCFVDRSDAFDHIESVLKDGHEQKPVTKKCRGCGRDLPLDAFPNHSRSRDGHGYYCPECLSKKMKKAAAVKNRRFIESREKDVYGNKIPEGMRRCTKCQRVLPLSEFGACGKNRDGIMYDCKDCRNKYGRDLYHRVHGGVEAPDLQRSVRAEKKNAIPPKPPVAETATAVVEYTVPTNLASFDSRALVSELRRRGYTVTCTRTVTEDL